MKELKFKEGERFSIIRRPGDAAVYRIMRAIVDFMQPDPRIILTIYGWANEADCRDGVTKSVMSFDVELDSVDINIRMVDNYLFPLLFVDCLMFAGATIDQLTGIGKCDMCGGDVHSKDDWEKHRFHVCGECGEIFESGDHLINHPESPGYALPPTD